MRHWTFRDYVNREGRNAIREWIDDQPIAAQLRIDAFIRGLELQERLGEPRVKSLTSEKGLLELRLLANKVQYRPIVCYGPGRRELTILVGAIEKGGEFEPKDAKRIARSRKTIIKRDRSRTCEHEFD